MTEERISELRSLLAEYERKKAIAEAAGLKDKAADIAADGVGRKALEALPELLARIMELEEYKASVYAAMCNESLDVDGVCPMSGIECPFEKECEDITTGEWLAVWRKNA